jgi:hypothetical protein
MREWIPSSRAADDGLDAVSGCVLAQPVRLGGGAAGGHRPEWRGGAQIARVDFGV